jgi:hypothetical protein
MLKTSSSAGLIAERITVGTGCTLRSDSTSTGTLRLNVSRQLNMQGSARLEGGLMHIFAYETNVDSSSYVEAVTVIELTGNKFNSLGVLKCTESDCSSRFQLMSMSLGGSAYVEASRINVTTERLSMQGSSRLDASARGFAQLSGTGAGVEPSDGSGGGSGGGHGGSGGTGHGGNAGGVAYGVIEQPVTAGSGGGCARYANSYDRDGGTGGGTVRIDVSGTLTVAASASIRVNGAQGSDSGINCCANCWCGDNAYNGGGGAAAGSIWITAESMLGSGSLQATGGAGGSSGVRSGSWQNAGGGGAGGRIAVHCASQLASGIAMSAVGGQRGANDAGNEGVGAPGIIFTSVSGVRTLVVDNAATSSSLVGGNVRLPASGDGSLAVHTLKIVNSKVDVYFSVNATLVIGLSSDVTTRVLNVTSLSTTSCKWLAHSRVSAVTMQLLNTVWTSAAPIAVSNVLKISGSTTLTTSASGGRIEAGTLLVETGTILTTSSISEGVLEVVAGTMRVQGTGAVRAGALHVNASSWSVEASESNVQTYSLLRYDVQSMQVAGVMRCTNQGCSIMGRFSQMNMSGSSSYLEATHIFLEGSDLNMKGSSRLDASARGFAQLSGTGAGAEPSDGTGGGSGGGHGGTGGTGHGGDAGGVAYGVIEQPVTAGSGGGRARYANGHFRDGGTGGGTVRIDVSGTLTMAASASIRVNGAQGADSGVGCCGHCWCGDDAYNGGGGAAAGSIWITAESMLGNGSLQATGGAGGSSGYRSGSWQNAGGGGAGGRIAVHCASQLASGIAMSAVGGQRGPNDAGNEGVGAPGTIFTSVSGVRTLVVDNAATSSSLVGGYVRLPAVGNGSLAVHMLKVVNSHVHLYYHATIGATSATNSKVVSLLSVVSHSLIVTSTE